MIRGFTFERALSWPFSAPHIATFPWLFGLAYAVLNTAVFGLIMYAASGDFIGWINALAAADGANDPEAGLAALTAGFVRLIPWMVLLSLAGWVLWAMFETASQRRYIWGAPFSLGFGADEMRMMITGLLWALLGLVLFGLPMLLIFGSVFAVIGAGAAGMSEDELGQQIAGAMLGGFGLMFLLFPVYVFFATRLAPCFGLTVKDKKIAFFDAWNVSRGRFWPILGAYLILAIAGGILSQVVSAIAQLLVMPGMMEFSNVADNGSFEEISALLTSPGFLISGGIYLFIVLFLQGVLQHVVGGPAAFAARHDPRGGVEETAQLDAFA